MTFTHIFKEKSHLQGKAVWTGPNDAFFPLRLWKKNWHVQLVNVDSTYLLNEESYKSCLIFIKALNRTFFTAKFQFLSVMNACSARKNTCCIKKIKGSIKAVYYTVVVHNFDQQEKATSTLK